MDGGRVRECSQVGHFVIVGASGMDSSDTLKKRLEREGRYRVLAMMNQLDDCSQRMSKRE